MIMTQTPPNLISSARPPHLPSQENGAGAPIIDVLAAPTPVPTGDASSNMPAAGSFNVQLASHPLARPPSAPTLPDKSP